MDNVLSVQNNPAVAQLAADKNAAGNVGKLNGVLVGLQQAVSSIQQRAADAAEELGFAIAGRKKTDIGKRKQSESSNIDHSLVEKARKYLEKVPGLEKEQQLRGFQSRLRQNPTQTARELLGTNHRDSQRPSPFDDDTTLYYAALLLARDALLTSANENKDTIALVESAIDEISNGESSASVLSTLNIADVAIEYSNNTDSSAQNLCGFYCDTVLDYGGLTATYKSIVKNYGTEKFENTTEFLLRAIAADLNIQGESIEASRMDRIMKDMDLLKMLRTVLEHCTELVFRMQSYYNQLTDSTGAQLMEDLLDLKDQQWVRTEHVMSMSTITKLDDDSHINYMLNEVKSIVRDISENAYEDLNHRDNLINIIQKTIDDFLEGVI